MPTTTTTEAPRLLTTREAAGLLRCSESRVRGLVAEGVLHPLRFAERGMLRFRADELDALIRGDTPAP